MEQCGINYPKGFRSAGVACGIKNNGEKDLALIVSTTPATCAGVFTQNVVKGHSLQLCQQRVTQGTARAILINSGNANACIGPQGMLDALALCEITVSALECKPKDVLCGSTGVIGVPLPMGKLALGIQKAAGKLRSNNGDDAVRAIMTTDTYPKYTHTEIIVDGQPVRIGAMAKGSGMIHPNMATMISVITTDITMDASTAQRILKQTADATYNRVSVDGDTSVCDKVLLLANGQSGVHIDECESQFANALIELCTKLSKMLAKDGEGATKLLTIQIRNAPSSEDAHLIAQAIAKSPLCKTAAFGEDANWGRLLTAAGYSGASFDPACCDVYIGSLLTCKDGTALAFDEDKAQRILQEKEVTYTIDLKQGEYHDHMWTCDLSYDYVKINGSYRT